VKRRGFLKAAAFFCATVALQPIATVLPSRMRTVVERIIINEAGNDPLRVSNKTIGMVWTVDEEVEYVLYAEISPMRIMMDSEKSFIERIRFELEEAMSANGIYDYMLVQG